MKNSVLVDTFQIYRGVYGKQYLTVNGIDYKFEEKTYKFLKRFINKSIVIKGNYKYKYKVFAHIQENGDNIQFTVTYSNWFITKNVNLHVCKNEFIEAVGLNHLNKYDNDIFNRHFSKPFSFYVTK